MYVFIFLKKSIIGSNLILNSFKKLEQGNPGQKQNFDTYSYFSHPSTIAYFKLKFNGFFLFSISDIFNIKNELYKINSKIETFK